MISDACRVFGFVLFLQILCALHSDPQEKFVGHPLSVRSANVLNVFHLWKNFGWNWLIDYLLAPTYPLNVFVNSEYELTRLFFKLILRPAKEQMIIFIIFIHPFTQGFELRIATFIQSNAIRAVRVKQE